MQNLDDQVLNSCYTNHYLGLRGNRVAFVYWWCSTPTKMAFWNTGNAFSLTPFNLALPCFPSEITVSVFLSPSLVG